MPAVPVPARAGLRPLRSSKRLLALAGDERLVEQIRRGNEAAFEVAFERHGPSILSYCRHMLGSLEEAEDAVQHAFAAAYRDLLRNERPITLKPWLFAIARNRCLSMLRARRDQPLDDREPATAGLADQVERRAELRDLLRDLGDLPEEQRAALLLAELGDLSHAEVAQVLGCAVPKVKALVFRARSGLIARREARDTPCEEIREQLANLRGGALRRAELRHHLHDCADCRAYRELVRSQRRMLAAVLPVTPSVGLKSAVLGSVGFGGGSMGGGGLLGGLASAASAPVGSATLAKVAVIGALAGGGAVAGEQMLDRPDAAPPSKAPAAESPVGNAGEEAEAAPLPGAGLGPAKGGHGATRGKARRRSRRGRSAPARRHGERARRHRERAVREPKQKGAGKDRAEKPVGATDPAWPRGQGDRTAKKPAPAVPTVPEAEQPATTPRAPGSRAPKSPRTQRETSEELTFPAE